MAAVKFMRSVRLWAYESFGTERAVLLVAMATLEDMRINAEHIRMADQFVEVLLLNMRIVRCNFSKRNSVIIELVFFFWAMFEYVCGGTEQKCSYFCGDKGDFTAWIDYQSVEEMLEVRFVRGCFGVGRPTDATFTVNNLRLNEVLDEDMYVGFSASTGGTSELHRVSSWEFKSTVLNFPTRAPSP